MLFRTLADTIGSLLLGLFDSLPEFTFNWPFQPVTITVPSWFPVGIVLSTLAAVLVVNAWAIALTMADFVYRHIPQVFGTGPGAG